MPSFTGKTQRAVGDHDVLDVVDVAQTALGMFCVCSSVHDQVITGPAATCMEMVSHEDALSGLFFELVGLLKGTLNTWYGGNGYPAISFASPATRRSRKTRCGLISGGWTCAAASRP